MPIEALRKFQDSCKLDLGRGYLSQGSELGEQQPSARAQVVIVGAGLAGLAAAQRLHEQGIGDVLILDAQDRVGGRVHTIQHGDYLLELGAQWLHGAEENPLHQWLTSMRMLDDFEDASMGFKGTFCCSDSSEQVDAELVARVLEVLSESKRNLFNDTQSRGCETGSVGNKNASKVFRCHLEASMARGDPVLAENPCLVQAIFEWFLRYETIENCCDHMDEVSIQSYTDWTDLGDGTLLNFKDGYQSLLAWFCEHFPRKQWLHLNKKVLNIELLGESRSCDPHCWLDTRGKARGSPIVVKYRDLSGLAKRKDPEGDQVAIRTIECQHVIVTVSLGFLKVHAKEGFFTPPLPSVKQTLIDSIGYGTVNKIVLQFERPFWAADSGGIKLVWRDEDFTEGKFPKWARDILAFDVVRKQPNLLIGWIGGQGAKLMELQTDEQVAEVCLKILANFLPRSHARPTKLVACLCSRWHSNPYTCGSYSFQSMKSLDLNVDKLHEPLYDTNRGRGDSVRSLGTSHLKPQCPSDVNNNHLSVNSPGSRLPRVMFAGEATAGKLYSTAHGAVISGWREADRLVDFLTNNNNTNNPDAIASLCLPSESSMSTRT